MMTKRLRQIFLVALLCTAVSAATASSAAAFVFLHSEPTFTKPVAQPSQGNALGNTWWFEYSYANNPTPGSPGTCAGYGNGVALPTTYCPRYKYCLTYRATSPTPTSYTNLGCFYHPTSLQPNTTYNPSVSLAGLASGTTYEVCIQDFYYDYNAPAGWEFLVTQVCSSTTIDSGAPATSTAINGGATYATNAMLSVRLTYADAVSSAWPATYLCTTSVAGCASLGSFTYSAACSNYPISGASCSVPYGGSDGTATVCASVADKAVPDQPASTNQSLQSTANFANLSGIQCDTIIVDRVAPSGTLTAVPERPKVGEQVQLTSSFTDATSGLAATHTWMVGDGGTHSGAQTAATFASAGVRTITVKRPDNAGNLGTATLQLTVDPASGTVVAITNTARPVISGKRRVGKTLSCSSGSWNISGLTFTRAWYRGTSRITRATGRRYTLVRKDAGKRIRCTVTARNSSGMRSASSVQTRRIAA